MSGNEKSTDPGLSAAERKTLRSREAEEPIAERMKELRRHFMKIASGCEKNVSAGPMLYPAPEQHQRFH